MRKESAVSDIIGAVLLISIVTASIGIVGVMVTRDIVPTNLPHLDFEACVHGGTVFLYHTGGDTLKPKESDSDFDINLLDANDQNIKTIQHITWINDEWSTGQVVNISTALHPILDPSIKKVQLVAKPPGGGETLIEWAQVGNCSLTSDIGCIAKPIADFSATPQSGEPPLTVTFKDESKTDDPDYPITNWEWNFGDGTYSTEQNPPPHIFSNPGTYTVKLRVHISLCGSSDEVENNIIVGTTCPSTVTADFSTDPNPPVDNNGKPLNVIFTDDSTSLGSTIVSHEWNFGDGTIASGSEVTHLFSYGIYWVRLNVTDACGHWDMVEKQVTVASGDDCSISPRIKADPKIVTSSQNVTLTDESESSRGTINSWSWEFGDGTTSKEQGPHKKTYINPGPDSRTVRVNLTVNNTCGATGTTYEDITVLPPCDYPVANFSYKVTDYLDFAVQFTDTSEYEPFDLESWYWEFGDNATSPDINPFHKYGGLPKNYTVNLTVTNECGLSNKTQRIINPNCQKLTPGMDVEPTTGKPPLNVSFNDTSTPFKNISSWRWLFGDGKSYYNTTPEFRNTTHQYQRTGTFYASLIVENECGEGFVGTKIITVASPANISGHLWSDKNQNGIQDTGEVNLSGWTVYLEERVGNDWVPILLPQNTDIYGNYKFSFSSANGIYRVKEILKTNVLWKATYAYNSDAETKSGYVVSGSIPIQLIRDYTNVDFGNVDQHTSSFQFPDRFKYGETDGGSSWSDRTTNYGEYWDYTTSYNNNTQRLYNPADKQTQTWTWIDRWGRKQTEEYTFYQVPPNVQWGDSAFSITPGFYMQYLIFVDPDGTPPISKTYWLKYWIYNSGRTDGVSFSIPDNTVYIANKTMLYFVRNDTPWSSIYVPQEGAIIPYSNKSYIEVHFTGTSAADMKGYLIKPVSSGPPVIPFSLTWQTAYGYYTGYWNNTLFENQSVLLEVQVDRGSSYPNINRYYNTQRNVWVDWEPIYPVITQPANNTMVSGNVIINATVTGKNRDTSNVNLVVADKYVYPMVWDSVANRFTKTLDLESFSGKLTKLVVRASPLPNHGKTNTSVPVYVMVDSKKPLVANFTADPWDGNATLEVAFTDNSSGGPNWWNWTFNDGNKSSLQNPFNYFSTPGNYNVTLQVKNASNYSSSVSKWVNVTGKLHDVTLLSSRQASLAVNGSQRWITMTGGASVTVNNTSYSIQANDRVKMDLLSKQDSSRILIAGTYDKFNATNTSLTINGTLLDSGNVTQISIPDFLNYHSNFQLTAESNKTAYVNLIWDGVYVPVDWRQRLDIYDLMPTSGPYMDLNISYGEVFFSGKASRYVIT